MAGVELEPQRKEPRQIKIVPDCDKHLSLEDTMKKPIFRSEVPVGANVVLVTYLRGVGIRPK